MSQWSRRINSWKSEQMNDINVHENATVKQPQKRLLIKKRIVSSLKKITV